MSEYLNEALADAEDVSGSSILDINMEDASAEEYVDADTEVRLIVFGSRMDVGKKADSKPYLRLDFEVADEEKAADILHFMTLPHSSDSKKVNERRSWRIRQAYEALGAEFSGRVDVNDLMGLECWAIVGFKEDDTYGPSNFVKAFTGGA